MKEKLTFSVTLLLCVAYTFLLIIDGIHSEDYFMIPFAFITLYMAWRIT